MKKKILLGSMLVLAMLLLMPSIPAIQTNIVEDGIIQDLQEGLETTKVTELKGLNPTAIFKFHPIFIMIYYIFLLRSVKGVMLQILASHSERILVIDNPIIFWRGAWLVFTSIAVLELLDTLFYKMGWYLPV